jgi:SGNH hydrolase-like domain, acetyltransferase AlgX
MTAEPRTVMFLPVALVFMAIAGLLLTGATSIRHLIDKLVASYLLGWGLYALVSSLPRAELQKRFIVVTLTIASCFVLAESVAVLGWLDYRRVLPSFDEQNSLNSPGTRYDDELIWQHEPYYQFVANYEGNLGFALCQPADSARKVAVRYDRDGFRNSADITAADIALLGDSYVESPMTDESSLFTTVLGELQGKTIVNLGHSGYGPQQELIVLKRFALPLHPKTIIWLFFEGNDFSDANAFHKRTTQQTAASTFWQNVWFRSFSRNLLSLYFHRPVIACRPNAAIARYNGQFSNAQRVTETIYFAPTEVNAPSEPELRRAAVPMIQAADLCRERGVRFIIAFVPEKFRVYHDLSNVVLMTEDVRAWKVNDVSGRLKRTLMESVPGIEYVDLTEALKSATRMGVSTYLPDDTHWSEAGHRVVAEALHAVISDSWHGRQGPR